MARVLPSSLSPHICVLPSRDLSDLLVASSLPSLPHILQSFSPLPQVTTRTTSLVPVSHASFALRFSDLSEIETACREDEEQRAVRTIDWIGGRIEKRCAKWVEDVEKLGNKEIVRTPWWDELKRCVDGDLIPSRSEGWNHPVAVILAVSTTAPNPLQAITALHSRVSEFPSWVDPTSLRYTLIIHPQNSSLSDEEASALFNAVKKQFGLHTYLLSLTMPTPPPPPVPVPALPPRLPPHPYANSTTSNPPVIASSTTDAPRNIVNSVNPPNTLRMGERDIQQTARFTREFLVMSLIPWMEKCVIDWNENFSSTRRLPSRLFSSTRRLFGSPSPSPAPTHISSSSTSAIPTRVHNASIGSPGGLFSPPSQQQRLAEFATILGDLKLAITVWEALRKDGKSGSDILPMLLSPSPSIPLYASHALSNVHPSSTELSAYAQLRSLTFAIRWESGIANSDFVGDVLAGERWLVWAAGNAEEPPSALLLAHAALLSVRKQAKRRAALWYLSAANRLEKCGIKPLTMYFLRKAHEMYKVRPRPLLSPSFWDSEGKSQSDVEGFDAIMSGIEHPLGRLLYTTGDVASAVQLFLGLLRGSPDSPTHFPIDDLNSEAKMIGTDKVFLDDFRVAFAHFKATAGDQVQQLNLKLPFTFCLERQTRTRLARDNSYGDSPEWQLREEDWTLFWRSLGKKERMSRTGTAAINEAFWVDLVLWNPLDAEVNLSDLTIIVQESNTEGTSSCQDFVDVESIADIVLGARESRTVPISVKSARPVSLSITHVSYNFLSLLPSKESLASRGRRLQDTSAQRQTATYATDVLIKVEVAEASHRLLVNFVDDQRLVLAQGETKSLRLWFSNTGTKAIHELWMVAGSGDAISIRDSGTEESYHTEVSLPTEVLHSKNSLSPQRPFRISLPDSTFGPEDVMELSIIIHATQKGEQQLCLFFVYREGESDVFYTARATRYYEVQPLLEISTITQPSLTPDHSFRLDVTVENISPSTIVQLSQVTTMSPTWSCRPVANHDLGTLFPSQSSRLLFGANRWVDGSGSTATIEFVSQKLGDVLHGRNIENSDPPPIDLLCNHVSQVNTIRSACASPTRQFIEGERRDVFFRNATQSYPHIPVRSYPFIFPLYNPASVDVVVFWEIPSQQRTGHIYVSGINLGASHAALKDIVEEAESAKVKRSMYAETQREKMEVLDAVRESEWNLEMDPLVVKHQADDTVAHNFTHGPCHVPVTFTIHNYSATHKSRFVFKLISNSASYSLTSGLLPPPYSGQLTFRGTLHPSEVVTIRPKLWITRPGTYGLGGWHLETEVYELNASHEGVIRHRYEQCPLVEEKSCLTVHNICTS